MFVAQFANGLCNVLFEEFIVQIRGTSLFFGYISYNGNSLE